MAFYINTNVAAINTSRELSMNQDMLATSMQRLSSGLRSAPPTMPPASSIGEALQNQVTGAATRLVENAQNGISLVQTAQGALNEDQTIVQRVRQLAVEGSNETLSQNDRKAITAELLQLNTEMNRIATATQFNGQTLLSNSGNTTDGGVGNAPPVAAIFNLQIGANVNSGAGGGNAASTLSGGVVTAGATDANMVTVQINDVQTSQIGNTAATASGGTAETASVSACTGVTVNGVTTTGVTSVNSLQDAIYAVVNSVNNATYSSTDATTDFQNLTSSADQANEDISSNRGNLGAYQNRLQHTINNLNVISQNLASAQSSIMNVDMAQETTNLAKYQILQQSGVAMLAQANQNPQAVMKLLG